MIHKTFFAGFGGQGVLSMGYALTYAGMIDDKFVTYFPSYGAEVRGGTANCTVNVGDEEIASPIASQPDFLVAMNTPSMLKFSEHLSPDGVLFLNTSLVEIKPERNDFETVEIPANDLAKETGSERSTNMVLLGALCGKTNIVSPDAFEKAIKIIFEKKKKAMDSNLLGFQKGLEFITNKN